MVLVETMLTEYGNAQGTSFHAHPPAHEQGPVSQTVILRTGSPCVLPVSLAVRQQTMLQSSSLVDFKGVVQA